MSSNEAKKEEKLSRKREREGTHSIHSSSSPAENEVGSMSRRATQKRPEFELNRRIVEAMERKSRCPENLTQGIDFRFAAWAEIQREIGVFIDDPTLSNKLVYFKKMHSMINLITSRGIQFDKESKRFVGSLQAWDDILMEYQSNDVLNDLRVNGCDFYDSLVKLCSRFPAVNIKRISQGSTTGSYSSSSGKQSRESSPSVNNDMRSVGVPSSDEMSFSMQVERLSKEIFKEMEERLSKEMEEFKAAIIRELKTHVGANTGPSSS